MPTKAKNQTPAKNKMPKRFVLPTGVGELAINLPGIWAPAPVHPGDPVNVVWRLLSAKSLGLFPDSVSAKIYLDAFDVLLYESDEVPLVSDPDSSSYSTTEDQGAVLLSPSQAASNQLYQLGQVALRLEVTSAKTGAVFINTNYLNVVAAPLVAWHWTGAQGTLDTDSGLAVPPPLSQVYYFVINHPFQLLGRITNIATNRGISVAGNVSIIETNQDLTVSTVVQELPFSLPAAGAHLDFISQSITKNWTWIIPGVWVDNPEEPDSKWFNYSVQVSYSDSYANVYPDITLGQYLSVDSLVTNAKKAYGDGALAALAAGLIAGIFSFGIGTAAGTAIAAGLGVQALDPPEPDRRYRQRVVVPKTTTERAVDDRFPAVLSLLTSVNTAVEIIDALGDIRNRLLGARMAKDRAGVTLQHASYTEAIRSLRACSTAIAENTALAIESVKDDARFNSSVLEETIRRWQRGGIPTDVRQALYQQGCTVESLGSVERALEQPILTALARDFTKTLGVLSFNVLLAAASVMRSAPSILKEPR